MRTTIRYIMLTAFRDWLFAGLALALLAIFGVSHFLGSNAVVEQQQMTLVYVASSTRILLNLGLVVFIIFHIRRMMENREVEVILTRPISRESLVFSYWLGFAMVALVFVVFLTGLIYALLAPELKGLFYWATSVLFEAWIMVAFAVFTGLVMRSAVASVLLSYAFYLAARMAGFFLYYVDPATTYTRQGWDWVMQQSLLVISWLVPRLDQFGQSEWLVYGLQDSALIFPIQALIYIPFLLVIAIIDFKRKQF